ncbi:MAG: DoxX family protein [Yoonia sp.]|uniref:DoxX family protein n=1 Tax=Yoonia sp. TaxID=2212373 RepID=UPI00273E5B3F|nr:DoxX family protein [Yoonia sp.]MDP5084217.1 DoxX family protein [Yoonia sp.]MDP5361342.1 DoxX family protein [Paracoccaceae bacterium]
MTTSPLASITRPVNRLGDALLPLLARLVFAAVLFMYYWNSGLTKLGDGLFGFLSPSPGAYVQIFPKAMEAVGYDTSQLGVFHWAVVTGGTIAEFVLPVLIVIGLFTRLAAFGMIGFIIVQSLTDLFGHGGIAHEGTLGAWFDRMSDALILDQRAFWVLCLLILVFKGAGALSIDRLLFRNAP